MQTNDAIETLFVSSLNREKASLRLSGIKEIFHTAYSPKSILHTPTAIDGFLDTLRLYKQRAAIKAPEKNYAEQVSEEKWVKFLFSLKNKFGKDNPAIMPTVNALIKEAKHNRPDTLSYSIYTTLQKAVEGYRDALLTEMLYVSGHRGISVNEAQHKFVELRNGFTSHPEKRRIIATIDRWVGTGHHKMEGFKFYYIPADYSVLYAIYRMRTDVDLFAPITRNIVSVDIETAGAKTSGFTASMGRIIEIGIVEYTPDGKEVSRYETLIKPEDEFLAINGTGAQHVHNISVRDLQGKPSFAEVSNEIFSRLQGRILLAQNASFEINWLTEHLPGFELLDMPVVDTMEFSRKFLPGTQNNKLETICSAVNVPYTNGHRALHDALVTGKAFFCMVDRIKTTWF